MKPEHVQRSSSSYKSTRIYLLCLNAALGAFFFGYTLAVFNPMRKYIQRQVYPGIAKCMICFMTSFTPLGSAFGALVAGKLASHYGRRKAMIITDLLAIVGVILTIVTDEYILLIGRLITGVCVGLNSSLVPLYISEFSPVELKGFTGSFYQMSLSVGINTAYILGLNMPLNHEETTSDWWKFMLLFPIFAPVVRTSMLSVFFRHETPKFLLMKGNEEKAISALATIHHDAHVLPALDSIREGFSYHRINARETYRDLFSPGLKKRFVVGCLLAILQQACANQAIISYSSNIFDAEAGGQSAHTLRLYTVTIGLLHLSSAFVAFCLLKTTGRRTLLIVGTSIITTSLLLLTITGFIAPGNNPSVEWLLFAYMIGFGISLGPITSLYLAEILPSVGIAVAMCLCWLSSFAVLQAFPFLEEGIGYSFTFFVFSGICILGMGFIIACVKETRNKSPLEIAEMFEKRDRYRDSSYRSSIRSSYRDSPEEKRLLESDQERNH